MNVVVKICFKNKEKEYLKFYNLYNKWIIYLEIKKIIKNCGCNLFPKSPDDNIYYEKENEKKIYKAYYINDKFIFANVIAEDNIIKSSKLFRLGRHEY